MEAGFEYIYIVLVVGYYIYKAVAARKKEQEQTPIPTSTTSRPKKKKSFLDDLLEQIENEGKKQTTPTAPKPAPVAKKKNRARPVDVIKEMPETVFSPYDQTYSFDANSEGGSLVETNPSTIKVSEQPVKKKTSIKIGSSVLSPRDAIVAQVVFDRKF